MEGVCGGSGACLYTSSFTVRCVLDLDIHLIQAIITVVFVNMNLGYGTLQCSTAIGSCPGSANNNCYPQGVWSFKQVSSTHSWVPELLSGSLYEYNGEAGHVTTQAFGVRCVLDLNFNRVKMPELLLSTPNSKTADKLCDQNSGYGTLRCEWFGDNCPGAKNNRCHPYHIWSIPAQEEGYYHNRNLSGGLFKELLYTEAEAFSVRCVLDLEFFLKYIHCFLKNLFCTMLADRLCDANAGYGTLQCLRVIGECPGAAESKCYPYHVWTGEGGQYELVNGGFVVTGGNLTNAFSVRCVLDLEF